MRGKAQTWTQPTATPSPDFAFSRRTPPFWSASSLGALLTWGSGPCTCALVLQAELTQVCSRTTDSTSTSGRSSRVWLGGRCAPWRQRLDLPHVEVRLGNEADCIVSNRTEVHPNSSSVSPWTPSHPREEEPLLQRHSAFLRGHWVLCPSGLIPENLRQTLVLPSFPHNSGLIFSLTPSLYCHGALHKRKHDLSVFSVPGSIQSQFSSNEEMKNQKSGWDVVFGAVRSLK